jgi:hypothetical protein
MMVAGAIAQKLAVSTRCKNKLSSQGIKEGKPALKISEKKRRVRRGKR